MKAGPDIARIAALVGDPARANMLTALMGGQALTAGELAREAGVTGPTASAHLAKLAAGGLVTPLRQGRHRYFRLSGPDVAEVIEGLTGLAERSGHVRARTGPREPALRHARVCYDHLAGDLGVRLFESLTGRALLRAADERLVPTLAGELLLRRARHRPYPLARRPPPALPRLPGLERAPASSGRCPGCRAPAAPL